jgi:hypothetical protein
MSDGEAFVCRNEKELNNFIEHAKKYYKEKNFAVFTYRNNQHITMNQHNSIYKYCDMLAMSLNESGNDMKKVFDSDFDIPWTKTSVKELIWNVVQEAMFKTTSIKELERDKVTAIYDVINRKISQKTGIFVPFPNRDNML